MRVVKNKFILFSPAVRKCKFIRAPLHHDSRTRKRKVKESALKASEVGDQSAHSSSG